MIKFGQVTAYEPNTRKATITYIRPDACEKCRGCGTMSQQGTITLVGDCKEGDWVRVELPDNRFLSATVVAYVIPLICFVAGLLLGNMVSEPVALCGSLLGLALGMVCMHIFDKFVSGKPEWTPRIAEVYDHKPDTGVLGCGRE
jgi:positive regulator of sigma E activity